MYKKIILSFVLLIITGFQSCYCGELYDEYLNSKKNDEKYALYERKFDELKIKRTTKDFFKYIEKGEVETVKLFLDAGMSPNVNYYNSYPIYCATKYNRFEIAKILIEKGARVNIGFESPLYYSLKNKNLEMAKILLENGADANYSNLITGETLLTYALKKKQYDLADLLMKYGAKQDSYSKKLLDKKP